MLKLNTIQQLAWAAAASLLANMCVAWDGTDRGKAETIPMPLSGPPVAPC